MTSGPNESFNQTYPTNFTMRHAQRSLLISMEDDLAKATPELIDLAIRGVSEARNVDLTDISDRIVSGIRFPDVWPGEHYKLLAGFVKVMQPKTVIEIGTFTGLGTLCLLKYLPQGSRLVTFDLIAWNQTPERVLRDSDFAGGRLTQQYDDLSYPPGFEKNRALLEAADLILVDAAKDGLQEWRFIQNFAQCRFRNAPLIIFDDNRVWNMLPIWRSIDRPKLDLTSFGHWSGTGLVLWG
ncbi:MAG: methyltransferase [Tepidisphaeraceae bacterium]|jgi:predicted O-methyltransferase YrrM